MNPSNGYTQRPNSRKQSSLDAAASATPMGARDRAVSMLMRLERTDGYLDKLLDSELSHCEMDLRDRRLLVELATGVVRWEVRLDWVLAQFYRGDYERAPPIARNAMRVALYQILFLDRIPHSAAVNESVGIVKTGAGPRVANMVNGVLRSIVRRLHSISWPDRSSDEARYFAVMYSHPIWMVERWLERFGPSEAEALLNANNRRPDLSLRVNPLRALVEEVRRNLEEDGVGVAMSPYDPWSLRVNSIGSVGDHPLFRAGAVTVQDEAAVLASRITGVKPGMTVIDLCAAPGGKATAMAEMLAGSGHVLAVDRHAGRLRGVDESARRLGVESVVETMQGDARTVTPPQADVVLVDAPCSGLGVIDRKPDIKRTRTPEDIARTVGLAGQILENASRLVRAGGSLVYTTCTIEPEENDGVIRAFIDRHPEYTVEAVPPSIPNDVRDGPFLRTYPHRHGIDGSFGAVLRRLLGT